MVPGLVLAGIMAVNYAGNSRMRVMLIGKARNVALMVGVPLLLFAEASFLRDSRLWQIAALARGAAGHILAILDFLVLGVRNSQKMGMANVNPRSKTHRNIFLDLLYTSWRVPDFYMNI